ncbi:MAG TPA: single-stranded-DNA-specific exonuclease RecJ [Herpetosiphonaceae bacterium]|nr:single-stranded-DNA-specific exonuclease RecJ [Herpetosiphonaceae bacterium]
MPIPARWVQLPAAPRSFLQELPPSLHPSIGQVLWNRGLTDRNQVDAFLNVHWGQLHDPHQLRDMDRAVARIRQAVEQQERVAVYGDFDTDGVTGVALLYQFLTGLGLDVLPYIPKRQEEGYGLHVAAVEYLATKAGLLITVDCGISNVEAVARAQALGMDVIILDHHTPPAVLPEGYAVINPKRLGCEYPYKMLAGVGVAFKLVQALHRSGLCPPALKVRQLLDIVALGTVTDVAPLDGENRVLVKYGLKELNRTERPGLQALIELSALKGAVTCHSIGYALGPRINAAGRLDDAVRAYELLLCDEPGIAREMAQNLNEINAQRRGLTAEVLERAKEMARTTGKAESRIIVLDGEGFPAGIVGLVAARLVEAFGRPVLVLERGEEMCRGSARSIAGFSIFDALNECADLFTKFGGHAMAAGFSLPPQNLPELEARLQTIGLRDLTDELLLPMLTYDAEIPLSTHSFHLLEQIELLEPFGHGNAEPLWVTRNLRVVDARVIGKERQHLKLRLHDGTGKFGEALCWNMGSRVSEFSGAARVDIAYTLEVNEWQGRRTIQMKVKDLRHTNGEQIA